MFDTMLMWNKALEVSKNAYCPYSKFPVGACVEGDDGKLYVGCNVENASYGLTICAERNAIGSAIVDGEKKVKIFGEEISINARIEYIEGYSGHADQTWLLNFIWSFTNPPKHVFLVHGEYEGQEELKRKIEDSSECKVTIPDFGETYTLDDNLSVLNV